jgi:hypothetical protein
MTLFGRHARPEPVAKPEVDELASNRRWEWRMDVKIDLAACLRNGLAGLALLVLAVASATKPEAISASNVVQALFGLVLR